MEYKDEFEDAQNKENQVNPSNDSELNELKYQVQSELDEVYDKLTYAARYNFRFKSMSQLLSSFEDLIRKNDLRNLDKEGIRQLYSDFMDHMNNKDRFTYEMLKIIATTIFVQKWEFVEPIYNNGLFKILQQLLTVNDDPTSIEILKIISHVAYKNRYLQNKITNSFPIKNIYEQFRANENEEIIQNVINYFYACSRHPINEQESTVLLDAAGVIVSRGVESEFDKIAQILMNIANKDNIHPILGMLSNIMDFSPVTAHCTLNTIGIASSFDVDILIDLGRILNYLGDERDVNVAQSAAYAISMLIHNKLGYFKAYDMNVFCHQVIDLYASSPIVCKKYVADVAISIMRAVNIIELVEIMMTTNLPEIIVYRMEFYKDERKVNEFLEIFPPLIEVFQVASTQNRENRLRAIFEEADFLDIVEETDEYFQDAPLYTEYKKNMVDSFMSMNFPPIE